MQGMAGLFTGTRLERPVTCEICEKSLDDCACPRAADGTVFLPKDQPLRVNLEKRRKGKTVTVVTGLDAAASDVGGILGQLKAACAAGGTATPEGIEIQGDHWERVAAILHGLGYPAKVHGRGPPRPQDRRKT